MADTIILAFISFIIIIFFFTKVHEHHPKMLTESCLVLIWNWNLMGGATKAEEVAKAVLVSLLFKILYSGINFSDGTKRGRTTAFSSVREPSVFHYFHLFILRSWSCSLPVPFIWAVASS